MHLMQETLKSFRKELLQFHSLPAVLCFNYYMLLQLSLIYILNVIHKWLLEA